MIGHLGNLGAYGGKGAVARKTNTATTRCQKWTEEYKRRKAKDDAPKGLFSWIGNQVRKTTKPTSGAKRKMDKWCAAAAAWEDTAAEQAAMLEGMSQPPAFMMPGASGGSSSVPAVTVQTGESGGLGLPLGLLAGMAVLLGGAYFLFGRKKRR